MCSSSHDVSAHVRSRHAQSGGGGGGCGGWNMAGTSWWPAAASVISANSATIVVRIIDERWQMGRLSRVPGWEAQNGVGGGVCKLCRPLLSFTGSREEIGSARILARQNTEPSRVWVAPFYIPWRCRNFRPLRGRAPYVSCGEAANCFIVKRAHRPRYLDCLSGRAIAERICIFLQLVYLDHVENVVCGVISTMQWPNRAIEFCKHAFLDFFPLPQCLRIRGPACWGTQRMIMRSCRYGC